MGPKSHRSVINIKKMETNFTKAVIKNNYKCIKLLSLSLDIITYCFFLPLFILKKIDSIVNMAILCMNILKWLVCVVKKSSFYNSRVYLNSFFLDKLDLRIRTSFPKIKIM